MVSGGHIQFSVSSKRFPNTSEPTSIAVMLAMSTAPAAMSRRLPVSLARLFIETAMQDLDRAVEEFRSQDDADTQE